MFWNRRLLYKGKSKGPMIDKMIVGTWSKSEDYPYNYFIFVNKNDYEFANSLISK